MKNFYQVALLCLWLSEDWGRSEAGLPVLSQGFQYYWAKNVNLVKSNWQITGYPASLRKTDAEAPNCKLHPRLSILKWEYDWILLSAPAPQWGSGFSCVTGSSRSAKCIWLTFVLSHQMEITLLRSPHQLPFDTFVDSNTQSTGVIKNTISADVHTANNCDLSWIHCNVQWQTSFHPILICFTL